MTGVRMTSSGLVAVMEMAMCCEAINYENNPRSTKELLLKQTQGKFLTPDEKKRVVLYAENKRKERAK